MHGRIFPCMLVSRALYASRNTYRDLSMAVKISCILHPAPSDCTPYQLFSVSTLTSTFTGKLLALKSRNPPGWPFSALETFPVPGPSRGSASWNGLQSYSVGSERTLCQLPLTNPSTVFYGLHKGWKVNKTEESALLLSWMSI